MELVKISSLSIDYRDLRALSDVNLTINSSDFIGIIGPNGGGKTTLMRALLKIIKPTTGSVQYLVNPLTIGYLPQHKTLDLSFAATVDDVVLSGLQARTKWRATSKQERQYAQELLTINGIGELSDRLIGELSGGQLQRVLLCRALICEPQLIVLDEPTTYVDTPFERSFYDLLERLSQQMAIVIVSHDVGTICSHVRSIACVNGTLHYHPSSDITPALLAHYQSPIQIIAHRKPTKMMLKNH